MEQALKAKTDGALDEFSMTIDEYKEAESRRQLERPFNVPLREIFDYDAATGNPTPDQV
jgi:hypothetical protein